MGINIPHKFLKCNYKKKFTRRFLFLFAIFSLLCYTVLKVNYYEVFVNKLEVNYSLKNYAELAVQVRDVEQEVARAEKGQPVDMAKTAEKLHRINSTLN